MAILDLLGRNLASDDAAALLAAYPFLKPESEDAGMDDGVETVKYLRSERDGLLIKASEHGDVLAIFLMSEGKDGFSQFKGPLPGMLSFSATRREVVRTLGAPAEVHPPRRLGSFELGELMRFDMPAYSVHFQFRGGDAGIELVTAMVPHLVPGRSVEG
ncbi:MAG TPA: hypothetical protein VFJ62_14735 [Usitatibacter sp.]|nr:hypothetical protein [Usitatibacter sp.]